MDAITRIACYFPAQSITSFWIVSNLIINNQLQCENQTRSLLIAVIVLFCLFVLLASFTDTYTASNNMKYVVLLMPFYGPACFSLPSDFDKDRVYDHFYLKVRDYVRAMTSMVAFLLIVLFINPIAPCLYPSDVMPGASRLDPAIMRTVPIVVAIVTALMMMCLGTPRQSLGFQNVEETCPPLEKQLGDNPVYAANKDSEHRSQMGFPNGLQEGDDDYEQGPVGYPTPPSTYAKQPSLPTHASHMSGGANSGRVSMRAQEQRSTESMMSSRSMQGQGHQQRGPQDG